MLVFLWEKKRCLETYRRYKLLSMQQKGRRRLGPEKCFYIWRLTASGTSFNTCTSSSPSSLQTGKIFICLQINLLWQQNQLVLFKTSEVVSVWTSVILITRKWRQQRLKKLFFWVKSGECGGRNPAVGWNSSVLIKTFHCLLSSFHQRETHSNKSTFKPLKVHLSWWRCFLLFVKFPQSF